MDARLTGDIVDEGDVINMRTEFGDGFTEHFPQSPYGLKSHTGLSQGPRPS